MELSLKDSGSLEKLLEQIEDQDDIESVYTNAA